MRDAPRAVFRLPDLGEALVGFQRVAAGRDEIDCGVEVRAAERGVRRRGRHLAKKIVGEERHAAGAAEHVLRQHVERADAQGRRVLRIRRHRRDCGRAFQHLEAIGRHEHTFRGLVHAVIGAADPLQQPRRALRRADIDHQIDVAPVDAEIERRCGDDRAQPSGRHRVLDLAPLADVERAVMQRDRQIVVVHPPQLLEDQLGLAARVDEDQRHFVPLDQRVDFAQRMARGVAGPGQPFGGVEHRDVGRRTRFGEHEVGAFIAAALRHQIAAQVVRLGDGCREPHGRQISRNGEQPREAERQQIAALRHHQRMQLVEDHALE